ncbi:MAG: phage baseplate assembly protein V [Pseudomonadota bacterium]
MTLEKIVSRLVQKVEQRFYGKYRGLVVDNEDPEQLGRLKVKVPSVLGGEVVTGWAFPCMPYGGGPNQGMLFIPEVDAGVWIEFEEGDLEYPIWVGTYWSKPGGESELPRPNDGDGSEQSGVQDPATRKIIKTLKGHTIQFEDKDGEEMITIFEARNGNLITMDGNGIAIREGQNEHEINMDGSGISVIDGMSGHEIKMESGGVSVTEGTAGHNVNLSSSGVTVETATGAKVEMTPAGITIDAGAGLVQVKGSAVMLGPGVLPVIRLGDMGVGNLGAPVAITITTNTQVLA